MRALGSPFRFQWPPSWGVPPLGLSGVPPAPSLRALVARFWVGVPPLSSPPLRPLALGAPNRAGGGGSPLSPRRPCPSPSARSMGFRSPPSFLRAAPINGAGLTLTGPPTDAAGAAPVKCAGVYPAALWFSSSAGAVPADWSSHHRGQSCAYGVCCRAPRAAGSILRPRLRLRVLHRRCTPWRRSVSAIGRLLPVGSGGGWVFVPPPPTHVRPPPVGIRTLWGLPGFRLPQGPRPLWGSSHPMTTRLPLRLCSESSHPAMTRLPLPLHWGSSRPGTTRPPRPLRGRSSRPETIRPPPPHSVVDT